MIKCNVAVSGLKATDDPAPGIAFIRSLRESGQWEGKIVGLAYDALDTGIYDRGLLDEVYLIPYPFNRNGRLQRLSYITSKTRIDVLMPLLDLELIDLPFLVPSLKEMGINSLLPYLTSIRSHLKLRLAEFCQQTGIRYPKQVSVASPENVAVHVRSLGTPVVVKGIIHESYLAYSAEEAVVYFNTIKKRWGLPVLLQEYLQGDEYNTDCLTDRDRKPIGMVAMRKLGLTDKGKAWSGVTVKDDKLLDLSKHILSKLKWVGPIELEFLKQRSSGEYYLLEINPRFGSWIYLAAKAGQNLPLAAVEIAMGQTVEPFQDYKKGLLFVRYSKDIICPIEHFAMLTATGELHLSHEKTEELA